MKARGMTFVTASWSHDTAQMVAKNYMRRGYGVQVRYVEDSGTAFYEVWRTAVQS